MGGRDRAASQATLLGTLPVVSFQLSEDVLEGFEAKFVAVLGGVRGCHFESSRFVTICY